MHWTYYQDSKSEGKLRFATVAPMEHQKKGFNVYFPKTPPRYTDRTIKQKPENPKVNLINIYTSITKSLYFQNKDTRGKKARHSNFGNCGEAHEETFASESA